MRLLSRLIVLVTVAMTMGVSASSAVASETVEVFKEAGATMCPAVSVGAGHMTQGGCHILVDGQEIELSGHVFGIEQHSLTCDNSFEIRIAADGTGQVSNMVVTEGGHGNAGCHEVRPCISEGIHDEIHRDGGPLLTPGNEAGEHAWPFRMEEIGDERFEGHVTACFHTGESIEECEGEVDFIVYEEHPAADPEHIVEAETADNNDADGVASLPENAGFASTHCEVEGHYDLEPEDELHINHLGA